MVVPLPAGLRQGQRARADRLEQGRRPPEEAAPQVAPPARDPRASMPRTPRSSCPTPTSSSRSRNACSARCRSTASAARRSRCCSCTGRSSSRSCAASARSLAKLKVGMPWEQGVSITPLPEPGKVGLHDRAASPTPRRKGARVVNEGGGASAGTLFYPAVVYPVTRGHEALPRGAVRPGRPGDAVRRHRDRARLRDHLRPRPAGQHLRRRPGADRQRWSIRWSTRSAASTSTASASAAPTCSRSPAARIRPRARCR